MGLIQTLKYITAHPLNRGRELGAVAKFIRWQLGTRLLSGEVVFHWVEGTRVIVRRGETGLTGNVYCGLDEFRDMAFVLHVVREDDLFIDVGANVGSYTILACGARGARGLTFEPVPETYERLLRNLRLNNLLDRVEAMNMGVADVEGELRFTVDENCMNHVATDRDDASATVAVRVAPLDSLVNPTRPTVIKIDVEGFETVVLRGAAQTLSNPEVHAVIMELNQSGNRYGYDEERILAKMAEYKFSTFLYDPIARALSSLHGASNPTGNTLFIRDLEWVERRIREAKPLVVGSVTL